MPPAAQVLASVGGVPHGQHTPGIYLAPAAAARGRHSSRGRNVSDRLSGLPQDPESARPLVCSGSLCYHEYTLPHVGGLRS